MIDPHLAGFILLGLAIVLAIIVPLLNSISRFSSFISLRWSCVAILLLIMVGVVIDFENLQDSTRDIVLRGGLIVVGIFIVLRTAEKILFNGWLKGYNLKGTIQKGDIKATAEMTASDENSNQSTNKD